MASSVTATEIAGALRELGVVAGDTMMVHSSLKSLGRVEGGAEAVIDALMDAVGKGGTVVVPTLTRTVHPDDWKDLSGLAFDPAETPSRVGLVTETLRRRPDARRSAHPTHSVAALGASAEEIVSRHGPTCFNVEGPFGKLCARNALLTFIGVFPSCNTTLHAVEEWMGMPYIGSIRALVRDGSGTRAVHLPGFPTGDRGFYKRSAPIHAIHEQAGIVRRVTLNSCTIAAIRARDAVRITAKAELGCPGVLLCENPGCDFCVKGRAACRANASSIADNIRRLLASPQAR